MSTLSYSTNELESSSHDLRPSIAADPTNVTVIEARPGWRAINFAELWRYRELIFFLTLRDIQVRYKQTVMGAVWALLQPLLTSAVFVILFGVMGRMRDDVVVPYLAFVFAGQIAWQFFAAAVSQCGQSLIGSANLISKVYFPRLIIPMAAVGSGLVDFLVALGMMACILVGFWLAPPPQIVLLPFMLFGIIISAIGVGSLLAALTVAYRDFRFVIPFLVQMWMFVTPVGYPLKKVISALATYGYSDGWLLLYFSNPMAGYVQGFRWCILGEPLEVRCFIVSVATSLIALFVGTAYFRRTERRFADIV
jgi:lipopolysaccharide transport system permease protein